MPNSYSRRKRSNNSTLALLSKPPLAPAPQVEGRLVTPGGVGQHSPAHGGHHSMAKPAPNIHLGPPANSGPTSGGEDDLERPRQGSVLDLGCFAQAHGDPLALVRRKPAIDAVALVAGFPGEVHLRRQQLVPVAAHLDMDVR